MFNCRIETVCIHLLNKCNLECAHCWAGSTPTGKLVLAPDATIKFLNSLKTLGLRHISLSGGEPLLYPRLSYLIHWCTDNDLLCTITSNGFDVHRISKLVENINRITIPATCKISIRISLDGNQSEHDNLRGGNSFRHAVESIKLVRSQLNWIGVNSITWPGFYDSLHDVIRLINDLRVDDWALITETPKGSWNTSKFNIPDALARFKKSASLITSMGYKNGLSMWDYLSFPHTGILLDADGDVKLPAYNGLADIVVGNFRNADILTDLDKAVTKAASSGTPHFFSYEQGTPPI